jgi:hypothetical protein
MLYRNWPAICEVSAKNRHLTLLLATIDLSTDRGQRLATVFPECFSDKPVQGAVPLSVLRKESSDIAMSTEGNVQDAQLIAYNSLTPRGIPYIGFDMFGNDQFENGYPLLPENISKDARIGAVVEHEGAKWVVVQWNDSWEEIHLAPIEAVDPNA